MGLLGALLCPGPTHANHTGTGDLHLGEAINCTAEGAGASCEFFMEVELRRAPKVRIFGLQDFTFNITEPGLPPPQDVRICVSSPRTGSMLLWARADTVRSSGRAYIPHNGLNGEKTFRLSMTPPAPYHDNPTLTGFQEILFNTEGLPPSLNGSGGRRDTRFFGFYGGDLFSPYCLANYNDYGGEAILRLEFTNPDEWVNVYPGTQSLIIDVMVRPN